MVQLEPNYIDSVPLTSFDLLKGGTPVLHQLGDNQYTSTIMNLRSMDYWTNTNLINSRVVYFVSPSEDPEEGISHGAGYGYFRISGTNETFRIVSPNNVTNAVLTVYASWYASMEISFSDGVMRINRKSL